MALLRDGFELRTDDFSIRAAYEPGDINQITVEEQWPTRLEYAERGTLARDTLRSSGNEHEKPWIRFVAPFNVMRRFDEVQRFEGLLEGLGFGLELETVTTGDMIQINRTMRYPSVERANRIRNEVLGSNGVTAVRHEGGEFSAFDSVAAFVNDGEEEGKVWVASSPPFEVHDMADHVLADLLTDISLNGYLRTGWGKYLARAQGEIALSDVPVNMDEMGTFKAFHPSWTVIHDAALHREDFTGRLSQALFFKSLDEKTGDLHAQVSWSISTLQSNINKLSSGLRFYEEDALGDFPSIPTVAQVIIDRCQRAEASLSSTQV